MAYLSKPIVKPWQAAILDMVVVGRHLKRLPYFCVLASRLKQGITLNYSENFYPISNLFCKFLFSDNLF